MGKVPTRAAAAALLGVPVDADAPLVRRAFRLWARSAHPDAGGSAAELDRLRRARDVLLAARPTSTVQACRRASTASSSAPRPRAPLRSVLRRPGPGGATAVLAALALALAGGALAALLPAAPALAVAPAAVLACAFGIVLADAILGRGSDAGHRVAVMAGGWAIAAAGIAIVAQAAGRGIVEVLPVLAVPLVAAASWLIAPRPWSAVSGRRG